MENPIAKGGLKDLPMGRKSLSGASAGQEQGLLVALERRLAQLERSWANTEARLETLQATVTSPTVLRAAIEQQLKKSAREAASMIIRLLCYGDEQDLQARILYEVASSKLRDQPVITLLLANEIRQTSGFGLRFLALASLLEMQYYRQRSAYGVVYRIYADEVSDQIAQGLHSEAQQQGAAVMAAHALVRMGRLEDAHRFIDEQLESTPGFRAMVEFKARLLAVSDPERAIAILNRIVVRKKRGSLSATLLLSELLSKQARFRLARQVLEERLGSEPNKDLKLGLANRAAYRGDWSQHTKYLSEFFGAQGLWAPRMEDPGERFSLKRIVPHGLPVTNEGPLVTVVMTAFNSEAHIECAVRSVLAQTYRNLELFVVDDVSSDSTRAIISSLAAEDPRVKPIFRLENAGTYVAKNEAIAHCGGEFVTCHDSDDWWHPQHLEFHVARMLSESELVATKSGWVRANEDGFFVLKPWGSFSHQNPASAMFRRSVVEEIGYFDSVRTGADTEYWHRTISNYGASRVRYMPRTLTIGLHHEASLTTSGAAAFDDYGVNLTRLAYCESWARWQAEQLRTEGELAMEFPLRSRRFSAPLEILSGAAKNPS